MISRTIAPYKIIALAIVLLLGIGFRFYNLDKKVFWTDEAASALRTSGYSMADISIQIEHKRVWSPSEVADFQHVQADRTSGDAARALATDDAKHPPLFYALLRLWAKGFGDSVFALRLLPAFLSLLVFPAAWWLCRELFFGEFGPNETVQNETGLNKPNANQVAFVLLALLALSPFHVLYAQEAREYSLLTAVYLASSALLLRATRVGGAGAWAAYALVAAIGFYTHTIFALMWLAHGAIVLAFYWQKRKANSANAGRLLLGFAVASLGVAVLFSPWAVLIWKGKDATVGSAAWLTESTGRWYLLKTWTWVFGTLFFDLDHTQRLSGFLSAIPFIVPLVRVVRFAMFLLGMFALAFVWRRAPRRSAIFICIVAVLPFIVLAIPDLVFGGSRSTIARFVVPGLLGVQFALAYLIAAKLIEPRNHRKGLALFGLVLCCGIGSCLLSSQSQTWWNKSASIDVPTIARVVNGEAKPLLVAEFNSSLLSINRLLKPQARIYFVIEKEEKSFRLSQIAPMKSSAVFFYAPPDALRMALQDQGAILEKAGAGPDLWRLRK